MENPEEEELEPMVFYGEPIEIMVCKVPRVLPSSLEGPIYLVENLGDNHDRNQEND